MIAVGAVMRGLLIDGVDDEGRGRGHRDGLSIAVRGALPGDRCDARIERVFAAHHIAQAVALHAEGSSLRTPRRCAQDGPCPGCPMEAVMPTFADDWRHARVVRACADAGLAAEVSPVVSSMSPRQKIKLALAYDNDTVTAGLFIPHSHELVDGLGCAHVNDELDHAAAMLVEALDGLSSWTTKKSLRAVVARVFVEGVVAVVVASADIDDDQWMELEVCVWTAQLRGLAWRVVGSGNSVVGGDITRTWGQITATPLHGHRAPTHVDAFCQADGALGAQLVDDVASFIRAHAPTGTIIDAYAGSGAFAAALATSSSPVVAIEEAAVCASSLQALPHVRAHIGRVHEVLPTIRDPIAAIVLDPPKKGAQEAIPHAIALAPPIIALVACDPDAGARDARLLCDAGYVIHRVVPYALFPGSIEVESLFLLSRGGPSR